MNEPRYWFPAKRYGWGWGLPNCWQGWVILFGYLLMLGLPAQWLMRITGPVFFVAYVAVLSVALLAICYWKGEPPHWRWGDRTYKG